MRHSRYWACILIIFAGFAFAEEPAEEAAWYKDLTFNAFVSTSYTYNFNKPESNTNQFRVFDFDDNSFKIDVAELVVQKPVANPGDAGFRFDLEAGASIPRITASNGLFRDENGKAEDIDLQQAYVSYIANAGKGLRFDFGKFITHAGAEVIEGYDGWNDNYSRSILFGFAIPFTHTGLKVSYPFSEKVSGMLMIVNGWDNVKDNNGHKTIGGQLTLVPHSTFTLYANFLAGPEQNDNDDDSRRLLDLVGIWKPNQKIAVSLNYDYASEQHLAADGGDATWSGFAGLVRYNANDCFAIIFRGEVFDDKDGVRTGVPQTLREFTITPEFKVAEHMVVRADLRFDHSDENVFDDNGGTSDNQTTLALNALFAF